MNQQIPNEIIDLVRFLCDVWLETDQWARKNMTADTMMSYPVVQGTANQMKLGQIAKQPYDQNNIGIAVEWLLREASK